MLAAEIVTVVWSSLGLILNLLTLYITGLKLKFNDIDLKLMGLISLLDIMMSLNHTLRIIFIWVHLLEPLNPVTNWCIWDTTVSFTLSQTTIEIVAILGVIRYLAICYNQKYINMVWIQTISISFLISLVLSLGNSMFSHSYAWSKSGLLCLPLTIKNSLNHTYFTLWLITISARYLISLFLITFCYYKVILTYREILSTDLRENSIIIELDSVVTEISSKNISGLSTNNLIIPLGLEQQIRRQRFSITFQLFSIVFLYLVSVCPDIIIAIGFTLNHISVTASVMATSHILFTTISIINPLFVLISHGPSRHQVTMLIESLLYISTSKSNSTFSYQ